MTRILVTGGAGYFGSHACNGLAAAGYEPMRAPALHGQTNVAGLLNLCRSLAESSLHHIVETARAWYRMHFHGGR